MIKNITVQQADMEKPSQRLIKIGKEYFWVDKRPVGRPKNPAAVALGSLGGKKSAQLLSPEQRVARAKKAVAQREKNRLAKKLPAF